MSENAIPTGPIEVEPYGAIQTPPPDAPRGTATAVLKAELDKALEGIELGAYDQRIVEWLAGWEAPTVTTVCSLLFRARAAGQRDGAVEVRELATAVRDALDIPIPASRHDRDAHRDLLMARADFLRGVLGYLVNVPVGIAAATQSARQAIEYYPVTYTPQEETP